MNLKYAIKEYKRARFYRKNAEKMEKYYRDEILRQCPRSTHIHGIQVQWFTRAGALQADKLIAANLSPDLFRGPEKSTAKITVDDE